MPLQCTICRAPQSRLWVVTTVRSTALKGHLVSRLMTPVFILISAICKKIGAWDTAIAQYKSTLNIKPDYVEALRNKGNVLQDKGDARAAIASYKNAIETEPKHAPTHYYMGVALQGLGDLKGAIDSYKQAIKIKPD